MDNRRSLVFTPRHPAVLYDNSKPRYIPHMEDPEILRMGLSPLGDAPWIETDNDLGLYHRHKLRQRERYGDRVYRATPGSLPAQWELSAMLLEHLCRDQPGNYRLRDGRLHCTAADLQCPIDSEEPLWTCSLWVADDLVIMEEAEDGYRLTAASLCSASHWRLEEKFNQPLRQIHDPVPDFHRELTPRIDRFLGHLRAKHPVVRYNWTLQVRDSLNERMDEAEDVRPDSPVYYRTERQSLVRLPQTQAIAFNIRVYLHPLEMLEAAEGALPALFAAIDHAPPQLAEYKGFGKLETALARYRRSGR